MPETPPDLNPKPLTSDEIQRLVGSLFLEIDYLRRQNAAMRQYIDSLGQRPADVDASSSSSRV
jgi:hypothetical protein